jgi:hypothetical protein
VLWKHLLGKFADVLILFIQLTPLTLTFDEKINRINGTCLVILAMAKRDLGDGVNHVHQKYKERPENLDLIWNGLYRPDYSHQP